MTTKKDKTVPAPPFDLTDKELALCREGKSGEVFSRKKLEPEKPKRKPAKKE